MSIRNALLSMALALSAAGMAADVYAQGKVENAYRQGPCSDDLKKFCARTRAGDGRIAKCMADHFRELRPSCQATVQAALDKQGKMATACKAEAQKFCKGIRPGEGRILSCLKGRESDLSPACAAEFKRAGSDPTVTQ
jgi:cysteine rich repeat protein